MTDQYCENCSFFEYETYQCWRHHELRARRNCCDDWTSEVDYLALEECEDDDTLPILSVDIATGTVEEREIPEPKPTRIDKNKMREICKLLVAGEMCQKDIIKQFGMSSKSLHNHIKHGLRDGIIKRTAFGKYEWVENDSTKIAKLELQVQEMSQKIEQLTNENERLAVEIAKVLQWIEQCELFIGPLQGLEMLKTA